MPIAIKRAYESPDAGDGYRVLVDRLWPRGLSRERLRIDEWPREVAPSDALRKAYHSGAMDWAAFRAAYLSELKGHRDALRRLARFASEGRATLVYSATDDKRNNAVVLRQYLSMLAAASRHS